MEKYFGKGSRIEISRRDFLKGTAMVVGGAVVSGFSVLLSACAPKEETMAGSPGTNEVWITGGSFVPAVINVPIDTTVTWTNRDRRAHTVTSDISLSDTSNVTTSNAPLFSGSLNPGGSFSYTFNKHGIFRYHCGKHPKMKGQVFVKQREGEDCVSCHDEDMTVFVPQ